MLRDNKQDRLAIDSLATEVESNITVTDDFFGFWMI